MGIKVTVSTAGTKFLGTNAVRIMVFCSFSGNVHLSILCGMCTHGTVASTGICSLVSCIFNLRVQEFYEIMKGTAINWDRVDFMGMGGCSLLG